MNLNEYQEKARETKIGLSAGEGESPLDGAVYCALGLTGEAGEVAEYVKKAWRSGKDLDEDRIHKIALELGDVLWYLACLAIIIDYDLETIAKMNNEKLQARKESKELLDRFKGV